MLLANNAKQLLKLLKDNGLSPCQWNDLAMELDSIIGVKLAKKCQRERTDLARGAKNAVQKLICRLEKIQAAG